MLAGSAAMGIYANHVANKQYMQQQTQLNQQQLDNQKNLNIYNQGIGLDTWNKTNYSAQVDQMNKAGVNPALLYGGGGGGGATMQQPGGSAQGGSAPHYGEMVQHSVETGIDAIKKKHEIDLIKKNEGNVGADTTNKEAATPGIMADSKNKEIQAKIQEGTMDSQMAMTWNREIQSYAEMQSAITKTNIDAATKEYKIERERLDVIQKGVEITNKEAQTKLTEAEIKETSNKINKIIAEIERMENMTDIQKKELLLKKMQTEFNTSTAAQVKQWTSAAADVLGATKKGTRITNNKNDNRNQQIDNSTQNNDIR